MSRRSSLTLGKRIVFGFTAVLLVVVCLGVFARLGVSGIVHDAEEVIEGNKLNALLTEKEVDHLNWANQVNRLVTDDKVNTLEVQLDDHKCAFGKWLYGEGRKHAETLVPSLAPLFKAIEEPHRQLHHSAGKIKEVYRTADVHLGGFLREMKADHLVWMGAVKSALLDDFSTSTEVQVDPKECGLGKWLYASEIEAVKAEYPAFAALVNKIYEPHERLHKGAITINEMLASGDRAGAKAYYESAVEPAAHETLKVIDELVAWNDQQVKGLNEARQIFAGETAVALHTVQEMLAGLREHAREHIMTDEQMLAHASTTGWWVLVISAGAILIGLLLSIFIPRSIVRVLTGISDTISQGAVEVAAAAQQLSGASQGLAQGTTEQAASLEETAASVEEISSMARQNTQNAGEAARLSDNVEDLSNQGGESMTRMKTAVGRIKDAADETANIVKAIDEIAFQTNLLALNAAVEAARAGDAGKGFAVVAEEVRNLAQRSAEAARETAQKIERSRQLSDEGVAVSEEVAKSLEEIQKNAVQAAVLVKEISTASDEQSRGLEQLNTAVSQMDQVTQQNAAIGEESAAASEELAAQSSSMEVAVADLVALVTGAHAVEASRASRDRQFEKPHRSVNETVSSAKAKRDQHQHANGNGALVDEHEPGIIDLEDNNFAGF